MLSSGHCTFWSDEKSFASLAPNALSIVSESDSHKGDVILCCYRDIWVSPLSFCNYCLIVFSVQDKFFARSQARGVVRRMTAGMVSAKPNVGEQRKRIFAVALHL